MIPGSIRGRLILWFAALLVCILAGFGVTAYEFNRSTQLGRIDDELGKRVAVLQQDWRRSIPPGGKIGGPGGPGGPRHSGNHDAAGKDTTLNRPPLPPPDFGLDGPPPGPPPDLLPPDSNDGPPDLPAAIRGGMRDAQLRLSSEAAKFFPAESGSFYFVAWTSRGAPLAHSPGAPTDVPKPAGSAGRSYLRTRDGVREMYHVTEIGDCVLVGVPLSEFSAANRKFAWWLGTVGIGVLLVGLGGGWIIVTRSLRPLHDMSDAAKRIADGALSERIPSADIRNELGGLAAVLNSTFSRLEASFSEQKSFTADASHELRTPLTVILTETQRSLSRERTADDYRRTVEICQDTAREMRALTESLLELARMDAGQETFAKAPADLADIASSAVEMLRAFAAQQKVSLTLESRAAPVVGDPAKLKRVVINLLQNAIAYNRPGGAVTVTTDVDEDTVRLMVSDTGLGIQPEDLPRIFDRFYRADKARSRSEANSGLGLSICKSIVEMHHGSIHVASTPDIGTKFTVTLPRPD